MNETPLAATMGVSEAKTKFSALLDRVANGETITVTRRRRDIAKIIPAKPESAFDWEGFEALTAQIAAQNKGKPPFDWKAARDHGRKN